MVLSENELERYDRQIRLFGVEAQERLKRSRVLVVGVGGLGSPVAIYLTAAGVGKLTLVDPERVELSNLNRQVLHWTKDVGRRKVDSAVEKLRELNPEVEIEGVDIALDESSARDLASRSDVVIDCLDNWSTRFLLNRVCVELGKPLIHAGIRGLYGQMLVIIPGRTPCLQCILPTPPKEERGFPVLGTTPGVMAMLQATETIKILTGYGEVAAGRLIIYDGYSMRFDSIPVRRRPDCTACSSVGR